MGVNSSLGIFNTSIGLANTSLETNASIDLNGSMNSTFDMSYVGFSNFLGIYVLPVITFFGLALNILSCIVFSSGDFRKLSSSVYIVAILVSDSGILMGLLCVWLNSIGYGITHLRGVCQGFVFFTYQFSFLSAWFLVCLTVEVYVITCHPLTSRNMCTRMTAVVITSTVVILSVFIYVVAWLLPKVQSSGSKNRAVCGPNTSLVWLVRVFAHIDTVLTLFLPFLTITSLMVLTGIKVVTGLRNDRISSDRSTRHPSSQSSHELLDTSGIRWPSISGSLFQSNVPRVQRRRRASRVAMWRVMKTLITLSLFYLVMNAPSHLNRLCYILRLLRSTEASGNVAYTDGFIHLLFMYLTYIYYSSKFFVFLIVSTNFSKGLKELKLNCTGF